MSYRYFIQKKNPVSSWMLDDTYPFQEYSGFGAAATKKSGTTDPTFAQPTVAGADFSTVFKSTSIGQFTSTIFEQGKEERPFAMSVWVCPIPKTTTGNQAILSHDTFYDGFSINGKVVRFGTQYLTTGTAFCTFDLQEYKNAHCVGIHTLDQNQLWVNGEKVAYVDITAAQQADLYVATNGLLYSGASSSNQEIALNAVEIYTELTGEDIKQLYEAGTYTMTAQEVAPQFQGVLFTMNGSETGEYINQSWVERADFFNGLNNNVQYDVDKIVPSFDPITLLSTAGTWTCAVPLDAQGDTSIYGAMVEWSGSGITVDTSLDGSTWAAATNGNLVAAVTSGYNPTNKDLQVRVNFPAGVVDGTAYLESLTIHAYRDNNFNNYTQRTVSASWPAVLRGNYEPILYRDDNGVNLHNATLTISTDTSPLPTVARTLEIWIKVLSGTPTVSVSGTKYRNGLASSTLNVGEWTLQHIVAAADVATAITITGDCIIGQVVLYPTALSASDVATIFDSYTGFPTTRFSDSGSIAVSEPATPVLLYDKDWSITSAG